MGAVVACGLTDQADKLADEYLVRSKCSNDPAHNDL
jgi:hypothetical protein